ncbi:hypothetical protein NEFER03_0512 [Nematocida sp. LUAm3]|nr:hypothetical protein NEFER03_0512 [Nematocida sp. LUAm3]KAI5175479.1 hypothetical protein NEFER02_1385 [Nematocida sp. LUAm2]KAI5178491.1 hypothetical protein NEFER01_1638 [Nematocida sp. LUAm1]
MHTFILGDLVAPSKYRKYIDYLQSMKKEGRIYERLVVDGLVERFIEIANDNYHIKEACAKKGGMGLRGCVSQDKITELIVSMQRSHQEKEAISSKESLINAGNQADIQIIRGKEMASPISLRNRMLHIREEFSELMAHTLSILLIISEIEEILKEEDTEFFSYEELREERHSQ